MTLTKCEKSAALPAHLAKYPTPFHVYYEDRLKADAATLKAALSSRLPNTGLYYSAKTNSLSALLHCLVSEGWSIETVCAADRRQASLAGAKGSQILLNGAAWTKAGLEEALLGQRIQRLTVDSLPMAQLLGNVVKENANAISPLSIALRVHDGNSHFGFYAETDLLKEGLACFPKNSVSSLGLHLHSNPGASVQSLLEISLDFKNRTEKLIRAAEMVDSFSAPKISFLDLGGGIDSPYVYRPQLTELALFHNPAQAEKLRAEKYERGFSLGELGETVSSVVADTLGKKRAQAWRIFFEPGRAVCSRALSTVIEVRAVKKKFYPEGDVVITDGNTAILGPLHRGIYPVALASNRPEKDTANTFVYGNLPHSGDWLFQSVPLPALTEGDRLLISHTGAYFLPLEANFGLPRPGIYSADKDMILRAPETEIDPGIRDTV